MAPSCIHASASHVLVLFTSLETLGEALQLTFRRSELEHDILQEQFRAYLTCTHELREYLLYLQSFPCRASCLVASGCPEDLKAAVIQSAREEWAVVQQMESQSCSRKVLNAHCLHVNFVFYREIMVVFERENYVCNDLVLETIAAWFPSFSQSSNLESIFRELENAVKKGGCPQESLANLACVAVRAMQRRICQGPDAVGTVQLSEADWSGKTVRGLKEKLWNPAAAVPSSWAQCASRFAVQVFKYVQCPPQLRCQIQV